MVDSITSRPGEGDIFVTWNRIREGHPYASAFESRGCRVVVAENAAWGNDFAGGRWYTLALNYHNTAGRFPVGGADRWDSLKVELPPWRAGTETVILPQRGIGPPGVAMPQGWAEKAARVTGGRVRRHPGTNPCVPLEDDLARCALAVTWGSGAAIKALLMGVPVKSFMPDWIGEQDNTDASRLAMFRRLAWAQWRLDEIADGSAFAHLLAR